MLSDQCDGWQPPVPLNTHKLLPFPSGVFPEVIEQFVHEVSRSTETPVELVALSVLAAIATCVQGSFELEVSETYAEPLCLWTAVFLAPGNRKSQVLSLATRPIFEYEATKRREVGPFIAEILSKNKTIEKKISELRKMAAKAEEGELDILQREIMDWEGRLERPPSYLQLATSDTTPESLAILMAANEGRMALLSDEAGIFDIMGGLYSGGIPNLDLFLKAHSGTPVRINRVGRPSDYIDKPLLSIGLTPQPEVLHTLCKSSTFRGRGLIGRFLFALPESKLGRRELNTLPVSSELIRQYGELLARLLEMRCSSKTCKMLKLTEEAQELRHLLSKSIEIMMSEGGAYEYMTDWAGKHPGQILRIGALLHIVRYAYDCPEVIPLSKEELARAWEIGRCLSSHAIAVFDTLGADPAKEGALRVLKWIKEKHLLEFTLRDCHYALKSRFKKVQLLWPCLDLLVSHGYIKEKEQIKVPNRPSRKFQVNPLIFN